MYQFIDKWGYGGGYVHIHPYKQKAVKRLIDTVEEWVEYLIVFGSSTQLTCRVDSDLDICVIGEPPSRGNYQVGQIEGTVDIILKPSVAILKERYESGTVGVIKDIIEKGVLIYAREENLIG